MCKLAGGQRPTHPNVPLQPALQLLAVNDPLIRMCHCNQPYNCWRSTTHSSECAIATSPTIAGGQRPTHPNVPLQPALPLLAVNDPLIRMCHCNQPYTCWRSTTHSSECAIATSPIIAGGQRPNQLNVPLQPALTTNI